jgi:perosamine synthetase
MELIPLTRPWIGPEEASAAAQVLASGWVAQGPQVAAFERAMCERVGAEHGVAVSSCTAGLHLALVTLGVHSGDEVVVPSLSFIATSNVVRYVGAIPIFADVDSCTQNLTVETIEPVLTPATRAVIVVHQAGVPADVRAIHRLCDPLGIAVVEDAACAVGSTYEGTPIGGHSSIVVFSFHPRKVMTTGEGGMVMTSRQDWAERLRRLREHGMSISAAVRHAARSAVIEQYLETGFNYRMTDIQAAVGLVQLRRLDVLVQQRRQLGARYHRLLSAVRGLQVVGDPAYGTTNFQSFWVVLPDDFPITRNDLLQRLLEQGISARRGIMAAHLEPVFAGHPHIDMPATERLSARSLILPLFHQMTDAQQDRIVDVISNAAVGAAA